MEVHERLIELQWYLCNVKTCREGGNRIYSLKI